MGFTYTRSLKDVFPTPISRLINLGPLFMFGGMLLSYLVAALLSFTGIGHEGYAIVSIQALGLLAAGYCFNRIRRINGRAQRADLALCPNCISPMPIEMDIHCVSCSTEIHQESTSRLWRRSIFAFGSTESGPRPRGTRSAPWWIIPVFMFAGMASALLAVVIDLKFDLNLPIGGLIYLMLGVFLLGPILVLVTFRKASRLIRLAREHDFLICESCHYPLGEVQDINTCPECGLAFDRYHLRRRWFESYGAFHAKKAAELDVPIGTSRPLASGMATKR